jgi:hypothetical protein
MALHGRQQRWAIMVAHRRAGKTVAAVADLVIAAFACRKTDGRFAFIAPLFNQSRRASIPPFAPSWARSCRLNSPPTGRPPTKSC